MPSLFKLSEASLLGLHAITFLAVNRERTLSATQLARACGSSAQHMAKVCRRLTQAGLLRALRGKQGGFRLERAPGAIRLSRVLAAFGEDLDARGCLLRHAACGQSRRPACIFGPELARLQDSLSAYFRRATVAQLALRCQGSRP